MNDFAALDGDLSAREREALDAVMAAVVSDPELRGRTQSFYDPERPSWLFRAGPFVLHYAYDPSADEVRFLNLFRRR